jgi:hypothetical protein
VGAVRRGLLAIAGIVVALLVAAQLALPGLAAKRLRSDLAQNGSRVHVDVSAFPAIKLLWHRADSVTISIADYDAEAQGSGGSDDDLPGLLAQTKATKKLDVRVGVLNDSLLSMQDVHLRKDGDKLVADVALRKSDIDAALPAHLRLTGRTDDGDGLTVTGQTSVFGDSIEADATIEADDDGSLVLSPDDEGLGLGDLVSVPVFEDKRVAVDGISARSTSGGYVVTVRGHLRG